MVERVENMYLFCKDFFVPSVAYTICRKQHYEYRRSNYDAKDQPQVARCGLDCIFVECYDNIYIIDFRKGSLL